MSSGIITVRCLKFTDGHVDEEYVYNTISDKRNIYCQMLMIKKFFSPYRDILMGYSSVNVDRYPELNITRTLKFQKKRPANPCTTV